MYLIKYSNIIKYVGVVFLGSILCVTTPLWAEEEKNLEDKKIEKTEYLEQLNELRSKRSEYQKELLFRKKELEDDTQLQLNEIDRLEGADLRKEKRKEVFAQTKKKRKEIFKEIEPKLKDIAKKEKKLRGDYRGVSFIKVKPKLVEDFHERKNEQDGLLKTEKKDNKEKRLDFSKKKKEKKDKKRSYEKRKAKKKTADGFIVEDPRLRTGFRKNDLKSPNYRQAPKDQFRKKKLKQVGDY